MKKTSRIGRGWRLTKDSWAILKADRSLLAFPIVGAIAATLSVVIVLAPGVGIWAATDRWWWILPFAAVALYLSAFATIYTGVGLAAATAQVMDGENATLRSGLAVARRHTGAIAKWALVQATVGLVINALQQLAESENGLLRIIGLVFTALVSVAWTLASFFVIPLLAFENLGPRDALKRSVEIIRARWGEGVVGSAAIGVIVFLLGVLPGIAIVVLGVAVGNAGGVVIAAVGVVVIVVAAVVGNTLGQVFRVALYRFATGGPAAPGFDPDDLEHAFRPKRRRGATSAA
ncbi:MAG: hypothetical protein IRZ32_00745 [Solirubrobacteraceae bacterium]|nr:hypothetical protein [Solirubrobacteraceae bacterium]